MNYKVLYRKYRPHDFSTVVEQNSIKQILQNSVKNNKIGHAYIFSGPRGTGKTTTARIFARYINCLSPTENGPCGKCDICKLNQENVDIIEIDAASNNGVDEVRELINNVKIAPSYSKYKVYIIDEVHMLSQSAFNALLLTLEEPPSNIVFILATTNIENVPITILSRCQRFDFKKISEDSICNYLKTVVEAENIKIEAEALKEIAILADGGLRDALSLLDQISFDNKNVTYDLVVKNLGVVSNKQIGTLLNNLFQNKVTKVLAILEEIEKANIDYKHFIKKMLDELEKIAINIKLNKVNYDYDKLLALSKELVNISNQINLNLNAYSLITMILLQYVDDNGKNKPVKTKEKQEVELPKTDYSKLKHIRTNNCFANAKKKYLTEIQNVWSKFIGSISENKKIMMLLIDSDVVAASDKYFIITNELESTVNLINLNLEIIENLFNKEYNKEYRIISLTDNEWKNVKEEYIKNIKNKKQYQIIEESIAEEKKSDNSNDIETLANSIFDENKIIVEGE